MKAKLAGVVLGMGMSLAALADTYHFTPIIDTNNPQGNALAIQLGDQLTMDVTGGTNGTALFTFTNSGSINSTINQVYFDDSPSNLFSTMTVASNSTAVNFQPVSPSALPGGSIPTFSFGTTDKFDAGNAQGVGNQGGQFLTLSATLTPGSSFADVINSLNAGDETDQNFLRVGLHMGPVPGIQLCGCTVGMSYLDKESGGGSPPPPVPEPETYGMLLAGLGLLSVVTRRRQKKN